MNFILIAIIGYFFLAVEAVFSKYLLTGKIKSWQVYLFYVGILSLFSLVFVPFGLKWWGWEIFLLSILSGLIFFLSLAFLFQSLKDSSVSRVYILYGTIITTTTFFLMNFFFMEKFTAKGTLGIIFLLIGGFFISFKFYKHRFFHNYKKIILAGILAGISLVILKYIYENSNFVSGYVYSRLGIFVGALVFVAIPFFRKEIFRKNVIKRKKKKNIIYFFGVITAKIIAGTGVILVSYSIFIGSVTLVNALISVQYLLTFLLATILAIFFKEAIRERLTLSNIILKLVGIFFIAGGVVLISV